MSSAPRAARASALPGGSGRGQRSLRATISDVVAPRSLPGPRGLFAFLTLILSTAQASTTSTDFTVIAAGAEVSRREPKALRRAFMRKVK